jgi:hypothetical protein
MAWRFGYPEPSGNRINWHMVRKMFTTRDGFAYLIQLLLFSTLLLIGAAHGLVGYATGDKLSIATAVLVYAMVVWPLVRDSIRGRREVE